MSPLRYLLSCTSTNYHIHTYVGATLQRLPVSSDHAVAVLLECAHPNIGSNCISCFVPGCLVLCMISLYAPLVTLACCAFIPPKKVQTVILEIVFCIAWQLRTAP